MLVSGLSDPGAHMVIAGVAVTADGSGVWAVDVPLQLGANVVEVTATDDAGNATGFAITIEYVVERAASPAAVEEAAEGHRHDDVHARADDDDPSRLDHSQDDVAHDDDQGIDDDGERLDDDREDHDHHDADRRRRLPADVPDESGDNASADHHGRADHHPGADHHRGPYDDRGAHDHRGADHDRPGSPNDLTVRSDWRQASTTRADRRKPSSSRRRTASERSVGSMPTARSTSTSVATPITAE